MSNFNALDLAILKTLTTDKKQALDFVHHGDTKVFLPEVWNFANQVVSYLRTHKELPTLRVLTEKLGKNNQKLAENIKTIWSELDKTTVNPSEYIHDLGKIKKRYAEKQLLTTSQSLAKLEPGSVDIEKAVSDLQKTVQTIKGLDRGKAYDSKSIKEYLPAFVERFNAKKNNPKLDRGLMSGYSALDFSTNGMKPSDFLLIAGETGFGKSLFLNNIAIQMWLQQNRISFDKPVSAANLTGGKDVIYFSLEMPYEDCFNRLISRLAGVPSRKIENADLTKEEFGRVKVCLDFIRDYPYSFKIVDIVDASANDIEAILNEMGEKFDAVFIDYLGIMRPNMDSQEADWLKQGTIAYEVRSIARRYSLPILSAVQLNRKAAGKEAAESIGLSRLARSSSIATHCTHVIQIENRSNEEKHPDFLYHIIKARKGAKTKGSLVKDLACATLLEKEDQIDSPNYDQYFKDQSDISEAMEDLHL